MDRPEQDLAVTPTGPTPARKQAPPEIIVQATGPVPQVERGGRLASFPYHPGDAILPGYRLVKRLGRGGFGEVWKATAPGGMTVAIKVLANLDRREGGREYRALQTIKNIHHAHIVPLFGVWLKTSNGRVLDDTELAVAEQRILAVRHEPPSADPAFAETLDAPLQADDDDLSALELIVAMGLGDQTLYDRLREAREAGQQGLPLAQLLQWMREAARALDHFNSGSRRSADNAVAIQHCDIKPQNILLVGDVVQVCDFGLARAQGEVRATSNNMASLAYAAPEMVTKPYDPSPATDQYCLALTYVELRTGRLPYTEVAPAAIIRSKVDGTLDLSALDAAEAKVLDKALQVDPARRFQSCTEMVRALQVAARSTADSRPVAGQAVSSAPAPAASAAPRRRWVAAAAAGAVALAGLGGTGLWFAQESPEAARARGQALEEAGRYAEAGEAYARAFAGRPDDLGKELWNLQQDAAERKRFAESIGLLRRLESLYASPNPPSVQNIGRWDVVNTLAWYLATVPAAGDAQRARALAEEALGLAARDEARRANSLDTLAAASARAGDWDRALSAIDEAIAIAPSADDGKSFEEHRAAFQRKEAWEER
jgi:serine/threonine protein kinase